MGIKKNIQYRYTPTGQKSLMIDPDGGRHTYLYDSVKQLTAVINPQGERTSYSYDPAGRRTVKKLANGSRTSFTYDAADRMTTVAHLKSDASVQSRFDYAYDDVGNRTRVAELDGSRVTYLYDVLDQLVGEHRTGTNPYRNTFTYDNRGNRTLKNLGGARTTSTYDDANQLTWTQDAGGRTTYLYDGNGNQDVTITPSGSRTTNVWDYENRLVGVRHPSGSRETMAYDPDGKRVQHETGAATTKFVWDGQAYLLETDASGITVATYTNEPTTYGRLISQRKSGATHYYLFDALGSTRLLTDSSQNIAESLLYDAWGNLVGSAPSLVVPFRWVGELGYLFVPSTGDYYVRKRILRPAIGRWISWDSIGLGPYIYGNNSPSLRIDPTGQFDSDTPTLDAMKTGMFEVGMPDCTAENQAAQKFISCCCTDITVVFRPTREQEARYQYIQLRVWARSQTWSNGLCRRDELHQDTDWHEDEYPENSRTPWTVRNRRGAFWFDMPGIGHSVVSFENTEDGSRCIWTTGVCPGPLCRPYRARQDFEVCAIGTVRGIGNDRENLGCVTYGHSCDFTTYIDRCTILSPAAGGIVSYETNCTYVASTQYRWGHNDGDDVEPGPPTNSPTYPLYRE